MPQDDIKPNLKVSQFAKTTDHYMCTQCGTLNEGIGGVCELCKETQKQIKNHYTNFKRN